MTKAATPRRAIAAARARAVVELVLDGKGGVDNAGTQRRRAQSRQAMIVLRPDDEIHRRLAAHDFGALRLGDATGDDDRRVAGDSARVLQLAELAKFRVDFFRGALADVTGVENDEVGVLRRPRASRVPLASRESAIRLES